MENRIAAMMNERCFRFRAILLAGIVLAAGPAVFVAGCGKDTPTEPSQEIPDAHIACNVHVIDEGSGISLHHIEGAAYIYTIVTHAPPISIGDIVVGTDLGGYIRRVTSVERTAGQLVLQTTAACLTDAVISGGIAFTIATGFGSPSSTGMNDLERCAAGATLAGGGIRISGLTLFDGEIDGIPASIAIDEGYVEFNPELFMRTIIRYRSISELSSVAQGLLTFDCDLSVDVPRAAEISGEMPLASAKQTFIYFIGTVPLVALVELELSIEYSFSGMYAGDCATRLKSTYDISLGAVYSGGGWSDIAVCEPGVERAVLACGNFAEAGMRIAIKPLLSVALYGEATALLRCGAYCDLTAHTEIPPFWEWSIYGGFLGAYGIQPEVLGSQPDGHTTVPLSIETLLGSGPYATDLYVFVLMWGSEGGGEYQFSYPRGIADDGSGNVYIVDSRNNRIQKFAPDSTFILKWGVEGTGEGQFILPAAVAVDGTGDAYITDSGNNRIQKFGPDTAFITAWGGAGNGTGEFDTPAGIAVDPDGNVYVVDSGNARVQKFTSAGLYVTEWGDYGSGTSQFDTPIGIASDGDGNIYVADCRNNRVQKFTSSGDFITAWGTAGTGDGEFDCPIAVDVDAAGDVYVLDYGNNRLQKFDANGVFLTLLGGPGTGEGQFDHPEGVAVDGAGNISIVDSRNARVQRFAPIPQ
jgi:DNA-binding beta-propeller fold protein YncE